MYFFQTHKAMLVNMNEQCEQKILHIKQDEKQGKTNHEVYITFFYFLFFVRSILQKKN